MLMVIPLTLIHQSAIKQAGKDACKENSPPHRCKPANTIEKPISHIYLERLTLAHSPSELGSKIATTPHIAPMAANKITQNMPIIPNEP
jgi:hypothetical protein